jgi:hypothetical protein
MIVIILNVIKPMISNATLRVIMLIVDMLSAAILRVVLLSAVIFRFIMLTIIPEKPEKIVRSLI